MNNADRIQGIFTAKTTVPVLTIHRVGCMPPATSIVPADDFESKRKPQVDWLIASAEAEFEKRSIEVSSSNQNSLLSMAEKLATGIDPNNNNMTVRDFAFLRQINTALFALNIVQSGLPLKQTCDDLQNSTIALNLDDNFIAPHQAASIVCYAAVYGLYFDRSFAELLSDLAAIAYAIQMSAYSPQTLQEVCQTLDFQVVSFLGIDGEGIRQSICNGAAGVTHTWPSSTMQNTSTTMKMTGNSSTPMTTLTNNTTTEMSTATITHDLSSATSAAGTVPPWFNTTVVITAEVTTMTAMSSSSTSESTQTDSPTPALADLPFFNPPQARRAALRRHGRSVL